MRRYDVGFDRWNWMKKDSPRSNDIDGVFLTLLDAIDVDIGVLASACAADPRLFRSCLTDVDEAGVSILCS